MAKFYIKF